MMVRDGKKVAPTCPECGCRLEESYPGDWTHYGYQWPNDIDAKGHKCPLLDRRFHKFDDGSWRHINMTQTLNWVKF